MPSAFDYREMARECMKEAEASNDAARKQSLEDIARFYMRAALSMEGIDMQGNKAPSRKH